MPEVVHDETDPNATSGSASRSLLGEIVRTGARFDKDAPVERPDDTNQDGIGTSRDTTRWE